MNFISKELLMLTTVWVSWCNRYINSDVRTAIFLFPSLSLTCWKFSLEEERLKTISRLFLKWNPQCLYYFAWLLPTLFQVFKNTVLLNFVFRNNWLLIGGSVLWESLGKECFIILWFHVTLFRAVAFLRCNTAVSFF